EDEIDEFLPPYKPEHAFLDIDQPLAQGIIVPPEYHMEAKYQMQEAMKNAKKVIKEVNDDFAQTFGRSYGGLIDTYRIEGAETALVVMGATTGTARVVVDELREKGEKVGMVKLRFFRPFPVEEIKEALKNVKAVGVFDRSISYGSTGQCFIETRNALYNSNIPMLNFISGLGGRDIRVVDIKFMFEKIKDMVTNGEPEDNLIFVNTRGING
ncbi:MAG: transketolase C-terminal domain-containing protein, partial [Candidatus Heimdallarchaeota archaeon]